MKKERIYLDYMASTPVDPRVKEAMEPFWDDIYAHPWSLHKEGVRARLALEGAQKKIAELLGVRPMEIIFTGNGTEANTLALRGVLEHMKGSGVDLKGKRVLISAVEHPSVTGIVHYAKNEEMYVDLCPITNEGILDMEAFKSLLSPQTVLVSVMYANSEIGTIQPIRDISRILKDHKSVIFHTDASQAAMYLDCTPLKLGVDMMTLDAHKIYGPKGMGMLFVKKGIEIAPIFLSEKERYLRSGTPAVGLIVGFAEAFRIAVEEREENALCVSKLRDKLIDGILSSISSATLNGSRLKRVPHNVSISFDGANHEFLLISLDEKGVAVATRSACLSRGKEGSHVLQALHDHYAPEAIRFSLGKESTEGEIESVIKILGELSL